MAALIVTALVAVIGAAQAAPQKKVFNATIDVQKTSTLTTTYARLRLTLANAATSNQTLGSANFVAPTGVTVDSVVVQPPPPVLPDSTTNRSGWRATTNGTIVEFRSTSNALTPSASVFADVDVTINATSCIDATWTVFAKQSNDFSGTGNDFTAGTATNSRPLGSFVIDDVETVLPAEPDDLHVPQILTNENTDVHVTPYDICGDVYSNYGSSVGRATAFVANPDAPARLSGVDLSITWSSATGIGTTTMKPTVVETGDFLSISDPLTASGQTISARSNDFDVVEELCTSLDATGPDAKCEASFSQGKIRVLGAPPPANPGGDTPSLGFGFSSTLTFSCPGDGGTVSPVGGAVVNINPRDYPNDNPVWFTVIYKKSETGNGPATSFVVCLSKNNGQTWGDGTTSSPLSECANTPVAPCVKRKRVTGGDLSVEFYIRPTDPWGGAR